LLKEENGAGAQT